MDVIGSEIGHKMRSAIKAKLTEIGCYVDDELPDYVMVMVANKRTRLQMEEDLNLFLGTNTETFVNWLHQVLKKLQEVSISTNEKPKKAKPETRMEPPVKKTRPHSRSPSKTKATLEAEAENIRSKLKKLKEKKVKHKLGVAKKTKKEAKKKKDKRKHHKKSKKKSKEKSSETIKKLDVPPLLMNLEKESSPSITDVFAGQILKTHGIIVEPKSSKQPACVVDMKPILKNKQVIDPETVTSMTVSAPVSTIAQTLAVELRNKQPDEKIKEMNEIEQKIQGLSRKLATQLDSISDDEDFLNIRTEAEELINDLGDDLVLATKMEKMKQSLAAEVNKTLVEETMATPETAPKEKDIEDNHNNQQETTTKEVCSPEKMVEEVLPQIELNLPTRSVRDRLGVKVDRSDKIKENSNQGIILEERLTPPLNSIKDKPDNSTNVNKGSESHDTTVRSDAPSHRVRIASSVKAVEASVGRVRPRPRTHSSVNSKTLPMRPQPQTLLLRAVAEAHKSLRDIPPKIEKPVQEVKRALVLPMRRVDEPQKIIIQVPSNRVSSANISRTVERTYAPDSGDELDIETESLGSEFEKNTSESNEYIPEPLNKNFQKTKVKYVPTIKFEVDPQTDDANTINIHHAKTSDSGPTFVVTLDGLDPNIFLAKKLKNEGLIKDESELPLNKGKLKKMVKDDIDNSIVQKADDESVDSKNVSEKKSSNIPPGDLKVSDAKKTKSLDAIETECAPKKRRASPIVFNLDAKKEKPSPKNDVVLTSSSSVKFANVPSTLPTTEKSSPVGQTTCRAFPYCTFGASCAFVHPTCKFGSACTRRDCVYSHPQDKLIPSIASHVIPVQSFKTITSSTMKSICKYYPKCVNQSCPYYHPKPCRFGNSCHNKLVCNFYHYELPSALKWKATRV